MTWANSYVGIPYRANGRDRAGCDCWGLIVLVFREQRGVTLPDWNLPADSLRAAVRAIAAGMADPACLAEPIEGPEPWAVVISERRAAPYHAGVCVGQRYVLHASQAGVVCPPAASFNIAHQQRTYWRWPISS